MITIITSSGGKNLELALKFEQELQSLGEKTQLLNLMKMDLPLYHSDSESKNDAKKLLAPWSNSLLESKAFVFLAPEYNGGIPPLLTNFIAWVSRSTTDWRKSFNGKSAALGTYSGGNGASVLSAMRVQLAYLGMNVLGRQILTNSSKTLDEASLKDMCGQLVKHAQL